MENNRSMNTSNLEDHMFGYGIVQILIHLCFAVVGVIISVLNGIVIIGFKRNAKIRQTSGTVFIHNLSISDFVTGILAIYVAILNLWNYSNQEEYLLRMGFVCAIMLASACFLLYLTVDRYLKVAMHLRYTSLVSSRKQHILCIATWVLCVIVGFLPTLGWRKPQINTLMFLETFPISYIILVIVLGQVPTCCMVFTYTKLYIISSKHRRQIANLNQTSEGKTSADILRSIALLIGAYIFCWAPIALYSTVGVIKGHDPNPTDIPLFTVFVTLGFVNSLLNPLIYASKIPELRAFFKTVCCLCKWKISPSDNTDTPS